MAVFLRELIWRLCYVSMGNAKNERKGTCHIEMSIAGGLAYFIRDDTLVDTTVGVAHRADDQAVDVSNCRG